MSDIDIRLFAIVELLVRMSSYRNGLGDYQNYTKSESGVIITTSEGSIELSKEIILKQAIAPEIIRTLEILNLAHTFKKF